MQSLPGVTCASRAHDLCLTSRGEQAGPLLWPGALYLFSQEQEEVVLRNGAGMSLKWGRRGCPGRGFMPWGGKVGFEMRSLDLLSRSPCSHL